MSITDTRARSKLAIACGSCVALVFLLVALLWSLKHPGRRDGGEGGACSVLASSQALEPARSAEPSEPGRVVAGVPVQPRRAAAEEQPAVAVAARDRVTVAGTVIDLLGGSIVGAVVRAKSAPASQLEASAVSDSSGRFTLQLAEGAVTLEAEAASYSIATVETWAPARDVTIGLLPGSSIVGRVVAGADGSPIAGALVEAENIGGLRAGVRAASTRGDGHFEIADISAGEYELTLRARRWTARRQRVTVPVGGNSDAVILRASAAGLLRGRVTVNGEPCDDGELDLLGAGPRSQPLDVTGSADFEGLEPGTYRVTANCSRPSAITALDEIVLPADELVRTWDLTPIPALPAVETAPSDEELGSILVQVAGADADRGPLIVVLSSLTTMAVRRRVDAGQALFDGLRPGGYTAYLDVAPDARASVVVLPDVQSQLTLAIPSSSEISGWVVDEAGTPMPDVWVRLLDLARALDDTSVLPVLTDAEGSFSFSGRFSGRYAVGAEGPSGMARVDDVFAGTHGILIRVSDAAPSAVGHASPP